MSLINQMLRDLEQRQSVTSTAQPGLSGVVHHAERPQTKSLPWGRLLVWVVLGSGLIAAALWWVEQPTGQPNGVVNAPKSVVSPAPVAAEPAQSQATEVTQEPAVLQVDSKPDQVETTIRPIESTPVTKLIEPKAKTPSPVKASPTVVASKRSVSPAEQARMAQQAAQEALQSGRIEQAIGHLQRTVNLQPTWVEPRTQLAGIYAELQQTNQAEQLLQQGLLLKPATEPWAMSLAQLQLQKQKPNSAIVTLRSARAAGAKDVNLDLLLAALYQRENRLRDAAELYQDVLARNAQSEKAWLGLAIVLQTMGQPRDALAAFREADRIGGHVSEVQQYIRQRIAELSS